MFLFFCTYSFSQKKVNGIEQDIHQFSVRVESNPDSAYFFIRRAYNESVRQNNDSLRARSLFNLGYYFINVKKNKSVAKDYFQKAILFSDKVKFYKILSYSYNQLGMIYAEDNKFDVALRHYHKAISFADKGKIFDIKSNILLNAGNLFLIQKDSVKAMDYYFQNISNAEQHKLDTELTKGYVTIALMNVKSNRDKALQYFKKALQLAQRSQDFYTQFTIHINLSDFYLNNKKFMNANTAFAALQDAEKCQKRLQDETLLFFVNFNYGGYYLKVNRVDEAIAYYQKALQLSQNGIDHSQILNLYEAIANSYIQKQDFKNALVYKEKFNVLKDSVFNIEKGKAFNEIQTRYEVDKKNLKISLLTKEKEIQKNKRNIILVVSFIILSLLLILVFFLKNRLKLVRLLNIKEQKIYRQEIERLEQEQEMRRIKGVVEGQDQERNRLAKEIHDGIGASLAGIKLKLSHANASLKSPKIEDLVHQLGNAFNELRSISHNLSINHLIDSDFELVVCNLLKEFDEKETFKTELVIFPENALKKLPERFIHPLYRIIQELLTNAVKHAQAKQVSLTFTLHEDTLNFIFQDDGCGFAQGTQNGIGLLNIKDRVHDLGGTLAIESYKNRGTTIIIDLPTPQES